MDASVFIRQLNSTEYSKLGAKKFSTLPRVNEFISAEFEGSKRFFQVIAVHHATQQGGLIEIYAIQSEPTWELKKRRGIGFGS